MSVEKLLDFVAKYSVFFYLHLTQVFVYIFLVAKHNKQQEFTVCVLV